MRFSNSCVYSQAEKLEKLFLCSNLCGNNLARWFCGEFLIDFSQNFSKSSKSCSMQYIEKLKTRGILSKKEGLYVVGPRRGKCSVFNDHLCLEVKFV